MRKAASRVCLVGERVDPVGRAPPYCVPPMIMHHTRHTIYAMHIIFYFRQSNTISRAGPSRPNLGPERDYGRLAGWVVHDTPACPQFADSPLSHLRARLDAAPIFGQKLSAQFAHARSGVCMRIAITINDRVSEALSSRAKALNITVSRLLESYAVEALIRNDPVVLKPVPESLGGVTPNAHTPAFGPGSALNMPESIEDCFETPEGDQ